MTSPRFPHQQEEQAASSTHQAEQQELQVYRKLHNKLIKHIILLGGEFFHEFEYEDWEEVDITRPVPLWICLFLVFGILFGGKQREDDVNKMFLFDINYRGFHVHTDPAVEFPECCLFLFHHSLHYWVW